MANKSSQYTDEYSQVHLATPDEFESTQSDDSTMEYEEIEEEIVATQAVSPPSFPIFIRKAEPFFQDNTERIVQDETASQVLGEEATANEEFTLEIGNKWVDELTSNLTPTDKLHLAVQAARDLSNHHRHAQMHSEADLDPAEKVKADLLYHLVSNWPTERTQVLRAITAALEQTLDPQHSVLRIETTVDKGCVTVSKRQTIVRGTECIQCDQIITPVHSTNTPELVVQASSTSSPLKDQSTEIENKNKRTIEVEQPRQVQSMGVDQSGATRPKTTVSPDACVAKKSKDSKEADTSRSTPLATSTPASKTVFKVRPPTIFPVAVCGRPGTISYRTMTSINEIMRIGDRNHHSWKWRHNKLSACIFQLSKDRNIDSQYLRHRGTFFAGTPWEGEEYGLPNSEYNNEFHLDASGMSLLDLMGLIATQGSYRVDCGPAYCRLFELDPRGPMWRAAVMLVSPVTIRTFGIRMTNLIQHRKNLETAMIALQEEIQYASGRVGESTRPGWLTEQTHLSDLLVRRMLTNIKHNSMQYPEVNNDQWFGACRQDEGIIDLQAISQGRAYCNQYPLRLVQSTNRPYKVIIKPWEKQYRGGHLAVYDDQRPDEL